VGLNRNDTALQEKCATARYASIPPPFPSVYSPGLSLAGLLAMYLR
jgi:hypothetical protein